MGIFVCKTLPSDQFDGEDMAIPLEQIHQISRRGDTAKVWVSYWHKGVVAVRPLEGTWEDNLEALRAAS